LSTEGKWCKKLFTRTSTARKKDYLLRRL